MKSIYHKFHAAGDRKLVREWKKSLTAAAKAGDMSETVGFQKFVENKFDKKTAQKIITRQKRNLNYSAAREYDNIQESFANSLIKKHNDADKLLYSREGILKKTRLNYEHGVGKKLYDQMGNPDIGLDKLDAKINKAFNKIIDNNLSLKAAKKSGYLTRYSPITQMISEMSGAGNSQIIQEALLKNPRFKDKEFLETFKYLNRTHAKDFIGMPFDEAFEYAKYRQGGLDIKGLVSYSTRYQTPENNILNFAIRHANRHFRDGTKSQVQFYKLRADGTKGAPVKWEDLPKNKEGNRVLDVNKVGFDYKNQFFHRNNLKTKGYRSGLFDEVYAMSGKNRLLVPDPNDPSKKITLKRLLQLTGDKLTVGHDEALGGVKGSPFKSLRIQGGKLNTALFHAYDKIQNKDLRKLILNQLEGQFKGLSGGDYQKAFIEGKIAEAKKAITSSDTLYRQAGAQIITDPKGEWLKWSQRKQAELFRVAGIKAKDISALNEMNDTQKISMLKKLGYKCRLQGGAGESVTCYMKDVEKTRADLRSPNVEVRAKALTKQRGALKIASKIPQIGKILKTGIQAGTAAITAPLKWLGLTAPIGYAIEGLVEGAFYDNARRKGYTHEQAFAETFTPRLAYEGFQGKSTKDVPWYGGAETLLEQELIGDPKQNPKVAQYVDALKEQDRIYDLIGKKEVLKDQPTTTDETLFIPGDLAAASTDVHDLARSGAYRRVDQTLKPESMAAQAYETAVERQKGRQDQRRREYLEKYDPGALKYEERTLSTPRQLEKRYEAMEEKYPTYTREQLEKVLEGWGVNTPWDAGFASGVKGYDEMGEWLKTHDKYKTMEAGVANVAEGGIIGLLKK